MNILVKNQYKEYILWMDEKRMKREERKIFKIIISKENHVQL